MPPSIRITKEAIIKTALDIIRERGAEAINARTVAATLGCSTQPVFSNFATMEELQRATLAAAYEVYLGFLAREAECGKYPQYKAFGMAYIRFAREERELFKLLFMCDRGDQPFVPTQDFDASVNIIMKANGVTKERAELMHLEMWSCVHGIAVMTATSFLTLEEELISDMISDVYHGVRARLSGGEK